MRTEIASSHTVPDIALDNADRHSPLGMFHLAEDFYRSAVFLTEARKARNLRLRFGDLAAYQLHAHSIEVFLKAFLRGRGTSNDDLWRRYGHKLNRLWKDCRQH